MRDGQRAVVRPRHGCKGLLIVALCCLCLGSLATASAAICVGDCDGSGEVTIDEIIRGVTIALGLTPLSTCASLDSSGDGEITVDEVIRAVSNALNGCPAAPTPSVSATRSATARSATPTPSRTTPSTATATATPSASPSLTIVLASPTPAFNANPATRSVGTLASTTTILRVLPTLFGVVLSSISNGDGNGSGGAEREMMFECPAGGSGSLSCDRNLLPRPGPPTFSIAFSQCVAIGSGGVLLTMDGAIEVVGQDGDTCATVPSNATVNIANLSVKAESDRGTATTTLSSLSAQATLVCATGSCACQYDRISLTYGGSIAVLTRDLDGNPVTSTAATFASGNLAAISVQQYDSQCEPIRYDTTVSGDVAIQTDNSSYAVAFTDYTLSNDASSGENLIVVTGQVESPCFGGAIQFATRDPLRSDQGAVCPGDGEVTVDVGFGPDNIHYSDNGVDVDLMSDGSVDEMFPNCLDPRAFVCVD